MKQTISILVENHAGVLSRVTGLFSRRGYNIDSLAVGETSVPAISRITIVVEENGYIVEQIEKQLNKLIDVIKVRSFAAETLVSRELVLLKILRQKISPQKLGELEQMCGAKLQENASIVIAELSGTWENNEAIISVLPPDSIIELVRTGVVALSKDEKTLSAD